jgi:low affinity Fe/Cu permease
MFSKIAIRGTKVIGSSVSFFWCIILIILWAIWGFFVRFSDTWQLVANTLSTLVTTIAVILIQYSQNKNEIALHIKLDAIIKSISEIDNKYASIEELDEESLKKLKP